MCEVTAVILIHAVAPVCSINTNRSVQNALMSPAGFTWVNIGTNSTVTGTFYLKKNLYYNITFKANRVIIGIFN